MMQRYTAEGQPGSAAQGGADAVKYGPEVEKALFSGGQPEAFAVSEADDNIAHFTPYATTCNGFCAVAF